MNKNKHQWENIPKINNIDASESKEEIIIETPKQEQIVVPPPVKEKPKGSPRKNRGAKSMVHKPIEMKKQQLISQQTVKSTKYEISSRKKSESQQSK